MKKILIILNIVAFAGLLLAATYTTPYHPDSIQAHINAATSGDTIWMDTGHVVWKSCVTFSNKKLYIHGHGDSSTAYDSCSQLWRLTMSMATPCRLSNFRIAHPYSTHTDGVIWVGTSGPAGCIGWRLSLIHI